MTAPKCEVLSVSSSQVACKPPTAEMGFYAVVVYNRDWGLASKYPVVELHSGVSTIYPTSGALEFSG